MDGLEQAERLRDALGEIFCLTFVHGIEPVEALRRMGAYTDTFTELDPDDMRERQFSFDAGYPRMAGAVAVGEWTLVLEPEGFEAAGTLLAAMSRGTTALSVLRHDYAHPRFTYAVNGLETVTFDPEWMDSVWGAEPRRLHTQMRAVGLEPLDTGDQQELTENAVARALLLASVVTGVTATPEILTAPMQATQIEPWFTDAEPDGGALRANPAAGNPWWDALVEAIARASPTAKRAAALAETRRVADLLDLTATPGLAETLADAQAGQPAAVPMSSPLGRQVRDWRRLSSLATWAPIDPTTTMSEGERLHGNRLGWFTRILRGALHPDPDIAVRAALYPLGLEMEIIADQAAHQTALRHLQS